MKARFLLFGILLLAAEYANAQQWYRATSNFYGRDINSVYIFNRNKMFYAGGREQPAAQSIFTSDDFGLSWDFIFDNTNAWIKSLTFSDTLHGFAVGLNGTMARSLNGYTNWTYVTPPVVTNYNKVVYADTQTLFAVGGNRYNDSIQVILKSVDGGMSWSVSYNQPGKWLKSVHFFDTQTGIAVGDSGTILKTTNGGTNWAPVAAPVARNFNALTFISSNTGFIVGGKESNDSIRTILKTVNGGNSWSVVIDEPGAWLTDVTFVTPFIGYAVGYRATLYKTVDGGQNWIPQTIPPATGNEKLTSIKFNDSNFGLIGGDAGNAFVYTNTPQPEAYSGQGFYVDSTKYAGRYFINTHGTPVEYHLNFSTSPSFSPLYSSYNGYLTSDTFFNAGIFMQGLIPNTGYYYRLMVNSILGSQFFDTLSFYTYTPNYTIETHPAANVTLNTAVMRGRVDKLFMPTTPYFQYSTNPSLVNGATVMVDNGQINDTMSYDVTAFTGNLIANTTYYYTLIAQTPYGFIAGDTLSFTTHDPGYVFNTLTPDNISLTTATLQGEVDSLAEPVNLFFEYGTTPNLGSTIAAVPALVNDNGYHALAANLTGLQPYTIYYYRLRGTGNNTQYFGSQHSFFTNDYHFVINTLPATETALFSATLNGSIDKFLVPVSLYFDYGATPSLGSTIAASPSVVTDSNFHQVSAGLLGLSPASTYFYRLRAEISGISFWGSLQYFVTGNPYSFIEARPATSVTTNSAQLNGAVAGLPVSAMVSFEYSLSPANWNSIVLSNGYVNDTTLHEFSTTLIGLSAGHVYYYRLKVLLAGVTVYSNIRQLYTGDSGIPNWDFQYWSEDTTLLPEAWNIAEDGFERVAGHSGSYGFKIGHNNLTLMGLMDDSRKNSSNGPGFFGGVPFNARPDSIVFYAVCDFAPGDSGAFVLYLHKDTTGVALNVFTLGGTTNGVYQRFAFPVSYSSALMPDSLLMGIVTVSFDGSNTGNNNSLTIDDISFQPPAPAVYNADMEHWYSYPHTRLLSWAYPKYLLAGNLNSGLSRTFYNQPYDYALEVSNVNAYGTWFGYGAITALNIFRDEEGGFPVNAHHETLNGYYQWYPVNGDTLEVVVSLFAQGNRIGQGVFLHTDSVTQFTPFDAPIHYTSPLLYPDTAIVSVSTVRPARGPSRSIIDKLSFDGFPVSVNDNLWTSTATGTGLKIYPNPAKDLVVIETESETREGDYVQLFNLNGQLLYQINLTEWQTKTELNMADLTAGFYLLNVSTGNRLLNGKVVVVK